MPDLAVHYVQLASGDLGIPITVNCIKEGSSVDQFRQLASYRRIIGSNSTFSWWAIWLHRVFDTYGFAALPQDWYGARDYHQPRADHSARGCFYPFTFPLSTLSDIFNIPPVSRHHNSPVFQGNST